MFRGKLQQYLPFTVLKLLANYIARFSKNFSCNSTYRLRYWNSRIQVLAASMECCNSTYRLRYWNLLIFFNKSCNSWVATVLTVYGIETLNIFTSCGVRFFNVATVLTVYGIETLPPSGVNNNWVRLLQQYLPFTVLKLTLILFSIIPIYSCNSTYRLRYWNLRSAISFFNVLLKLQQYLPFTVLKRSKIFPLSIVWFMVATVLTVYGIETVCDLIAFCTISSVATVLTVYGIETI